MVSRREKHFLEWMHDHERPVMFSIEFWSGRSDHDKVAQKLISEGYIEETKVAGVIGGDDTAYKLTAKGYAEFKPWWQKAWGFFTNDLAKVLSVIATALSIIAIIVSFTKH